MIDDGAQTLARAERGGVVEAVHLGHAVALTGDGAHAVRVGDPAVRFLPRSTLKPLQAVAMLRLGLDVDEQALALACASHRGEPGHVDGVRTVLTKAGLVPAQLRTPPAVPDDPDAAFEWRTDGRGPAPIAHMCSGKHAAMLATCAVNGWDLPRYRDPGHPLQLAIHRVLCELTTDEPLPAVVDGCGAPAFSATLAGVALAYARIATAREGTPEHRVAAAMRTHPWFVGGTATVVTELMRAVPGLIAKTGAEGCFAAAMPDGRVLALKVLDGASRPVPALVGALLRALHVEPTPGAPARDAAADYVRPMF